MAQSSEIRLSDRFIKLIDTMQEFHPGLFALGITTRSPLAIQQRVLDIFLGCVAIWAGRYSGNHQNSDELRLYTTARRIQDMLDHYESGE